MIGLLGVGISSFQSSEQISVSSKIREQVVGDLVQEGWSGILKQYFGINSVTATTTWVGQTPSPQTFNFDEYGTLLTSTTGALFQATVTPCTSTTNPTTSSQGAGPASSASLLEFQIAIRRVNVPATIPGSVTTYTAFVGHN